MRECVINLELGEDLDFALMEGFGTVSVSEAMMMLRQTIEAGIGGMICLNDINVPHTLVRRSVNGWKIEIMCCCPSLGNRVRDRLNDMFNFY